MAYQLSVYFSLDYQSLRSSLQAVTIDTDFKVRTGKEIYVYKKISSFK